MKSAASLILTFSLPILHHYHIHQNAPKGQLPLGDIKELLALGTKGAKVQQLGVWGDNRVNIYQQDKKFDYDFEQGVNLRYIWIYRVLSPHPLCGRI